MVDKNSPNVWENFAFGVCISENVCTPRQRICEFESAGPNL